MSVIDAIAFRDPSRARTLFEHLPLELRGLIDDRVERMLQAAADPDGAFDHLVSLAKRHPEAFRRIAHSRAGLQYAVAVFSQSRFLSEEVLQHPEWLEEIVNAPDLFRVRLGDEFRERIDAFFAAQAGLDLPLALSMFRREQLLRILVRDVAGFAALADVTEEISNLAACILHAAYTRIRSGLIARYGRPMAATPDGERETKFSVIALGKLGGCELNYSSDVDLMFLYDVNGETDGRVRISNKEFYKKLSAQLTDVLSTYTAEGICYRVDLRLRPEGRFGEVCVSLEGAREYYHTRARDWELQMLIKARPVAGDAGPAHELLEFVEPLIYNSTLDFSAVEAVSEARERISEKQALKRGGRGPAAFDVKLARGGIRDIEFLVQCLQRLHGAREGWVRHGGTMLALSRLCDKQLLSPTEYWRLASAYQFLRNVEHRLQFLDDRQTHSLPEDAIELDLLARRMPTSELGPDRDATVLLRRLNDHLENVQDIYERVIHAQKPMYYTALVAAPELPTEEDENSPDWGTPKSMPSNLIRFLDQKAPGLASVIASRGGTRRGAVKLEHFLEHAVTNENWMNWLDSDEAMSEKLLDIFEHSDFLAEQFVRSPEIISVLHEAVNGARRTDYRVAASAIDEPAELRQFFRRELARIECESVGMGAPIFDTLGHTSDLAEAVIASAYRMAVRQTLVSRPPGSLGYEVGDQMMVIALGRLGQREFDLASDADLIFVIPDADAHEQLFWTRVAERAIDLITAYTGEGVIFAVDTRLRPNGRSGPLVQTVTGFRDYFANSAEAWEGIAYMKSRGVAGNIKAATDFLHDLQDVDWRRWGQSGRSRADLRTMRARLEKEQGTLNPLKAGRGGYYDIDFALMYLRLKSAGMFFPVLNTPERIDIIERMGHLDREEASFLRDAAVFYRSVDHALRVFSGQAEGDLPTAPAKLAAVTELITRWTPAHLHDQPLRVELRQIQECTRSLFERLFA